MTDEIEQQKMNDEVTEEVAEDLSERVLVRGEVLSAMPLDLYIPPDALKVFLAAFEGPLDLLLYLIKRQNLDILDIPVAEITRQYMEYIDMMADMKFELAADYLVMAAMLAEIKSRLLLPKQINEQGEEVDPRAELVRRLQEYEQFKKAAEELDNLPRRGRDTFEALAEPPDFKLERPLPNIELRELAVAFSDVLRRAELNEHHRIEQDHLSVRERMSKILSIVRQNKFVPFAALFEVEEGRLGVVVSFIAILELFKGAAIEVVQSEPFAPIYIKAVGHE